MAPKYSPRSTSLVFGRAVCAVSNRYNNRSTRGPVSILPEIEPYLTIEVIDLVPPGDVVGIWCGAISGNMKVSFRFIGGQMADLSAWWRASANHRLCAC
jgi:hypothetical protein